MTPKQVERLEKTLGRVAREQGLDQERLRRWSRFSHFAAFWRAPSRKVSSRARRLTSSASLIDHPQLFQKLSSNAARRIIGVALRNNTSAVHQLLSAGWPAGAAMESGQTALHFAAWHGNVEMVRDLISHNAPINVFEAEHGGSPLAWALYGPLHSWEHEKGDYPGVTRALLIAGAAIPKPKRPLEAAERF